MQDCIPTGPTKESVEMIISRLKEHNLCQPDVRISVVINRHETFAKFYLEAMRTFVVHGHSVERKVLYCSNLDGLMAAHNITEKSPKNWRLSIDGDTQSQSCAFTQYEPTSLSHTGVG